MEKNLHTDHFERLLKEKSDEFKMMPSKRVWHSIYNDLHPSRKWPSLAMSIILLITLLFTGYLNTTNKSITLNTKLKQAPSTPADFNNTPGNNNTSASIHNNLADIGAAVPNTVSQITNAAGTTPKDNKANGPQISGKDNTLSAITISGRNPNGNNKDQNVAAGVNTAQQENKGLIHNQTANIEFSTVINTLGVNDKPGSAAGLNTPSQNITEEQTATKNNAATPPLAVNNNTNKTKDNTESAEKPKPNTTLTSGNTSSLSAQDRAWMEDYALHNKKEKAAWKARTMWQVYAAPSLTFKNVSSNNKYAAGLALQNQSGLGNADNPLNYSPSLGLELGGGLVYAATKRLRYKAGLQFNYTNYNVAAWKTSHSVLTTLTMNDPNSDYAYLAPRPTLLSSETGEAPLTLHNRTYQVSAVAGIDFKLFGNENIQWYVGITAQPSYTIGGKAYLASSDKKNYVADNSMLRKFNIAGGLETFINYKTGNITWQLGPQIRYQLLSTYDKRLTQKENLLNAGIKIGLLKSF
jgi:hypothetical protein